LEQVECLPWELMMLAQLPLMTLLMVTLLMVKMLHRLRAF
jgi:hypothetical protein